MSENKVATPESVIVETRDGETVIDRETYVMTAEEASNWSGLGDYFAAMTEPVAVEARTGISRVIVAHQTGEDARAVIFTPVPFTPEHLARARWILTPDELAKLGKAYPDVVAAGAA